MLPDDIASPRPRRKRRVVIVGATVLALAGAGAALTIGRGPAAVQAAEATDKDKKAKEPPTVAVAEATPGAISAYVTATANLVPEDEVKVVAEADGRVVQLLVEEGDRVARGQKLVQVDRAAAALAVDKAEIASRKAGLDLARAQQMAADKLISAQDLDKARYEADVARQALAEARHTLEKTTVVAPFAGQITTRKVQSGQAVKPGDELFTLADQDPLVARIFLPEREVIDLSVGQEATMALKAREEVRFAGRIRQISPVVDTASGTVKVTVEAVKPPASVRPGAFVTVGIVRESRPQALLVPREAVVREMQESYVFVADGQRAKRRAVTVGLEEGGRLEIISGLKAGEKVVTSGHGALKENAEIRIAAAGRS